MRAGWLILVKIILSVELAFGSSTPRVSTYVEQVSAVIRGQTYKAQLTQVQMPASSAKDVVVNEIAIVPTAGPPAVTSSVKIELPARLNGGNYLAQVNEPLSAQDRSTALAFAQNQVDSVRRSAPAAIGQRVQSFPTYGASVPMGVINETFSLNTGPAQTQLQQIQDSAIANSDAAFAGIQQEEQVSNQEAAQYAQALQQGQNMSLGLRKAAEQSSLSFTQSVNNFSLSMQSLQDRAIQSLALQIVQSDPVVQNILSDGEGDLPKDIRQATAEVSPLNPHAAENLKRYGDRFSANGLLRNGLFANSETFPTTASGHRLLESANMLSDAVQQNPSLGNQTASRQLVGAGYDYLHAAMEAQRAGRSTDADRWTAQGRRIARALRGDSVPDDLDAAIASSDQAMAIHEQALRDTLGINAQGRDLLAQGFAQAHPSSAYGQIATTLGLGLIQNPGGLTDRELRSVGLTLLDVALGMVPVVSSIKSLLYMAAGRNLLTGQPLSTLDYILCAVDVLSLGGGGPLAKLAGKLPEVLGPAFSGSKALLTGAMASATAYLQNYSNFVKGAVSGIRDIESVAPGFALKNFASNPGAVLALGQNVSRYGGAELAKDLVSYATRESLDIVETAHISNFAGGYSKFVTVTKFEEYGTQAAMLTGKDGGRMFVVPTTDFEQAAKGLADDAGLGKWLGLEQSTAKSSGGFMRLDMEFDLGLNPRLPNGSEAGANAYFRAGGKTSGEALELAIDPIPMGKVNVRGKVEY